MLWTAGVFQPENDYTHLQRCSGTFRKPVVGVPLKNHSKLIGVYVEGCVCSSDLLKLHWLKFEEQRNTIILTLPELLMMQHPLMLILAA